MTGPDRQQQFTHHDDGLMFTAHSLGAGEDTVLLLPGGPGYPAATMRADAELLADSYRVLLIDPPGTGATPKLSDKHHPSKIADFYVAACTALDVTRCAVVGWSFGGLVGVYLASKAPQLVRQLALVSSNIVGTEVEPDPSATAYRRKMLERHQHHDWYPRAREVFDSWTERTLAPTATPNALREMNIAINPLYLSDPGNAVVRQRLNRFEADLIVDLVAMQAWESGQFQGLDARTAAATIQIPVLVISGEHDWLAGPPFAQATAEAFPLSTLVVLAQCGHMPSIEQPEAYRELLLQWLRQPRDFE